ncbi:GlsB/YeaQ/YmgE family stress response membrane protein [Sphingomonas sp. KC8]|uniref:GlsB/YeaQ/YmgE family stress response membrane protein n=1 Tax=Sphingomonas sp. KC8 TaxID=1030157 RepID=UPI0002489F83|nr:GlsB/YeaQ/YmgE family stress response membrane protein [Sphingomonas sp. KC8]ARS28206.1 transglycosylase [Sphingomonas sp. KC8]
MTHGVLGWLLIGLVAGVLGKIIMPGRDPGGFIVTILLGIAGALLAGYIAMILDIGVDGWIRQYGAATAGAVVLLILYRIIMRVRAG